MSLTLEAPAARWFCQALPFSPTPKYKLQVHTTAHGQVSCCQNPVWSAHADSYYNMLHSVTPAKSEGILKWDTSLKYLCYVTEQMIRPERKWCRQLSNRGFAAVKLNDRTKWFYISIRAKHMLEWEVNKNNKVTEFGIFEFKPLLLHRRRQAKFPNKIRRHWHVNACGHM